MADSTPIFRQLADRIEGSILDGTYPEGTQVPSINEFAAFLRINPATANKGIALLVDDGILQKRRGIGMFVADGARARLRAQRQDTFTTDYIQPLLAEAARLEIAPPELSRMIQEAVARTIDDASAHAR